MGSVELGHGLACDSTGAFEVNSSRNASRARGLSVCIALACNAAVILCCVLVLTGAVFFGFGSCGGYAWHKDVFRVACFSAWMVTLLLPSSLLASWQKRLAFTLTLPVVYLLVEAVASTFYPASPTSILEFGGSLLRAIVHGPC